LSGIDPHALSILIRWLHVAAMAVALGGAALVTALVFDRQRGVGGGGALLEAAERYEWFFWAALGVLAMSGIGNVAALGSGLPTAGTGWGATFVLKLLGVVALALLSVPRTLVVVQLRALDSGSIAAAFTRTLQWLYAGTVAGLAAILAFAVWLAHG
jgi:hypothetical protein